MTEKVFSPLPTKPVVINQEVTDEEKHVASYNITKAVNAAHVGEGFESMSFSLIAISITLHAIWEMLNKKEPPTVSGKDPLKGLIRDIDRVKEIEQDLAQIKEGLENLDMPEKEEAE